MNLHFFKYHGCGNDFIILDNRNGSITLSNQQVKHLCDRHFGIGADGLMLLENEKGFDFKMVYYNSDGNISSLCGNGSRCITSFAQTLGIIKDEARFLAADGEHYCTLRQAQGTIEVQDNRNEIALKMNDVNTIEDYTDFLFLNTGSPHVVKWVKNLKEYDVFSEGRKIRQSEPFNAKGGTNVNFVEQTLEGIFVRTYERGVENETLSCGTGVTACALVASQQNKATSSTHCKISTPGGDFTVSFTKTGSSYSDIWLKGPATFVYEGNITIN